MDKATEATAPTTTVTTTPPKPENKLLASLHAVLVSRKWRAMMVGNGGALALLIPQLDKVWAYIVLAAVWAFNIGAYILGIAIEDNGTKRAVVGDTNITVSGTTGAAPTVRAKRTSLTSLGSVVTDEVIAEGK